MVKKDGKQVATLERAIELAVGAHRGQQDRSGRPYILHPLWLMHQFEDSDAMITAVLHDTVEDTALTLQTLKDEGFSNEIIEAIDALTRRKDETYAQFIQRLKPQPLARRVKLADIEHNLDVRRLSHLNEDDLKRFGKYHQAWCVLRDAVKS